MQVMSISQGNEKKISLARKKSHKILHANEKTDFNLIV